MKISMKERLKYKFENFMARGGKSIFMSLLVLFVIAFGLTIIIRWGLLLFFPEVAFDEYVKQIWTIFLQITDPGNMGADSDSSIILKVSAIITGMTGVVIFSMLIAFITTQLEEMIYRFRKGRSKVIENGHTLIIGWNEKVFDILRELIIANESEKYASVVILADEDKEEMDDTVNKQITDSKTTRIITRSGDPFSIIDLKRVNASAAKSAIILAECSNMASTKEQVDSDTRVIKTIMALIACQENDDEIPIIAEIFTEDKRQVVKYFNSENIIAVDSSDILGKLLVQTSLTSGLEMVYNEILSFDGSEIYFYKASWDKTKFYDLPFHFEDGIVLGIHKEDGQLILRPPEDTVMEESDEILILADDDSTIHFRKKAFIEPKELPYQYKKFAQKERQILILGWHAIGKILVSEYSDYLEENSVIDIAISEITDEVKAEIDALAAEFSSIKINLREADPLDLDDLTGLNPYDYNNVIILSQDIEELSFEKIDSDTLIILLLLRRIAENTPDLKSKTKIITQVLNSENQDLIIQTDVDDFIISNKLVTMVLAQLSEEPGMNKFYEDIFSESGSEIYVKSAKLYFDSFPVDVSFADILKLVNNREEICLGVRYGHLSKDALQNFGVELNPPKDKKFTITDKDFLVVLAEDDL
jgi:hypothetical protein